MIKRVFLFALGLLSGANAVLAQTTDPFHYEIVPQTNTRHGAVVCAHPLAAQAGLQILQKGGNAVDAAIAVQLALAVVYPEAGNIGGGGFMVARLGNKNVTIDYREAAPGAASRDMYLDEKGNPITALSLDGHLACGVPGTIAGLVASHKYGRLPFRDLVAPAILLAEKGFVITQRGANDLNWAASDFKRLNSQATAFTKAGTWKAGDTLVQPELAHTLRLIAEKGADGFYKGETARRIVAEMQRGKGIMTLKDLAQYKAVERTPTVFNYHGYTILTMPLPSSGGVVLQQLLGMVAPYPLSEDGFHSVKATQLMIEAERRGYADRAAFLGDPDFVKVPVAQLTSEAYLKGRMQNYNPTKASRSEDIKAGVPGHESDQTTHLCVVDADGNAVSVTTTLNNGFGSRVVVGGAGFILNDEMDDFSVKPGVPNLYGLVGAEANAIAPHKRMLSSMTPSIVLKDGKPYLVCGTPGGSTIITSVFQTIVNVLDFHRSVDEAVNAPKFHHQWLPDQVDVEPGFPDSTITGLEQMGYKIHKISSIGRTEAILINADHTITSVGDHRGDDSSAGY